mmetsp:Transcript_59318/g.94167  ORF Transcript_59318/g.94167 Transcript_59318/m.94167 type:complete len:384 (+) Transcript_59318:65-1216(+)
MGTSASRVRQRRDAARTPQEYIDHDVTSRYDVGRRIGRGCYGIVYEAREGLGLRRECAIKKILFAFKNSPDAQRTYREISYLLQFAGHKNIMHIYDVIPSRDDKHLYMVCEILDADLAKAIKSSAMTDRQQKFITYQVLRGLKYIHSAGVVHRDIKPANIFLTRRCETKIGDFGWARSLPVGRNESALTEYPSARWYRSPELILGGNRYNTACDIWAVGCIAGEMNSREPMLPGDCTQTMLELIIDMLGKPSKFDIMCLEAQYAEMMLDCLPPELPRRPIPVRFHGKEPQFIDFLQLILQMNPEKRMDVNEALQHPHMANFHNPDDEPAFGRKISLPVPDHQPVTATRYRVQIYADYLGLDKARAELEDLRRKELRDEAALTF